MRQLTDAELEAGKKGIIGHVQASRLYKKSTHTDLGHGFPTIIGVVVGLAGALGLNRLIASVLFGVQPADPTTLAAVTMTITLVAAGACWLPAWRAARLDPNVVLRAD